MEKDVDSIIAEYANNGTIYSDFTDKYSKSVHRKAEDRLYSLGEELKINPAVAREVIDKLLNSTNIGAVSWIAVLAISIDYRKQEAVEALKSIYNNKENGLICMLVKATLAVHGIL